MNLSRKELIIVALLMNLGVLTVIVSLSTVAKSESFKKEEPHVNTVLAVDCLSDAAAKKEEVLPTSHLSKETKTVSFDEIDQLLEEYIPIDEDLGSKLNKANSCTNETPSKKELTPASPKISAPLKKIAPVAASSPKSTPLKEEKKSLQLPSASAKSVEKSKESQGDKFYIVQQGDNPWKIAKKFHISFERLLELNNLNEKRARNLKVGERLKIQEDR